MIDILMATYNGGLYIENQILSLLAQTFSDWRVLVHDDGSTDDTMAIVRKYAVLDSRVTIVDDGIKLGNAGLNFLHLLSYADSEYIIFCDQDDIWFESKLTILVEELQKCSGPSAVYCNAYGYNGRVITAAKVSLIERNDLSNSLFLNSGVQGCSLMFNKKLRDLILDLPDYICMHDHYVTMSAICFGELRYVDSSLMLYRQHDRNVTGNVSISLLDRLRTFLNRNNSIIDEKHFRANESFFMKFKTRLNSEQQKTFQAYLDFPLMSLTRKICSVIRYRFRIGKSRILLIIKILFKKTI
ncbi:MULTISPECIES: glycosyltransferase family 2 protein [Sphingobacterium]|uniref:glycosyltransferase family 2 protein n=1 Tax=Sphingobacterium TaxID=28453 RepID=UPI00257B5E5A|nr:MULTISPECIES: glycosyltransferase family 2 protein [Sphingobacterium]